MTQEQINEFESYAEAVMADGNAAGLAVAIVDKNGKELYHFFKGLRDKENGLPIDENTIFGVASITKSFTTVCLLQLVQKGIISLDSPVSDYIPEYKGFHDGEPVRVKHFLYHAGGYFPMFRQCIDPLAEDMGITEEKVGDFAYYAPMADEGLRRVCSALDKETAFNGRPGERMSYCNDGFAVLSEIVHRYGGENSFAEYVKKHVMEPLGMTRSSADYMAPAADPNSAVLYSVDEKTKEPRADHDYHNLAFMLGGGGAVKSTVSDMCRYLGFYLNEGLSLDGQRVLDGYYVREMSRPRIWYGPDQWYGYGLSSSHLDDITAWGHGGSLPGVSSYFQFSKEMELGVVVLCNTEGVNSSVIADAAMRLANGCKPEEPRIQWQTRPWSDEKVREVVGNYSMEEGEAFRLYLDEKGELTMEQNGAVREVYPVAPDMLIVKGKWNDGFIFFYKNDDGNIFCAKCGSRIYPKRS